MISVHYMLLLSHILWRRCCCWNCVYQNALHSLLIFLLMSCDHVSDNQTSCSGMLVKVAGMNDAADVYVPVHLQRWQILPSSMFSVSRLQQPTRNMMSYIDSWFGEQALDHLLTLLGSGSSTAIYNVDSCLAEVEDLLSYCNDILSTGD